MSAATPRVLDMAESYREPGQDGRPNDSEGKLLSAKQLRARARRRYARADKLVADAEPWLRKPYDEWDDEEIARGRPRDAAGGFRGRTSRYVSREVHERAMERFKGLVRENMNSMTLDALTVMRQVIGDDEEDKRGRPRVPASVKIQAAQYLLDHIVGRPMQPTKSDISVKLQGILGTVMVNPGEDGGYVAGQVASRALPGDIIGEVVEDEDYEEDDGE
jgi:hypothetical protein